ncbi:MAG: hypothetical protein OEX79_00140 [Nitrosopumilus sp.]|nr:hypothetical protein [Nitrosopumilus sp.]MDH5553594.1 hypothetical protein [Nitrosopumilus sp.]
MQFLRSENTSIEKIEDGRFYSDTRISDFQRYVKNMIKKKPNSYSIKYVSNVYPTFWTVFLEKDIQVDGMVFLSSLKSDNNDESFGWYVYPDYVSESSKKILRKINQTFSDEWNTTEWTIR